jgi:cytidyltransferase-like protein
MKRVLANGVFDIFHIGHLRYLEAAAAMGDVLIVSVTRDACVNKGNGRPIYPELERLAVIKALRCVSGAFLTDGSHRALELVKPAIFVKGAEYRGKIRQEDAEFCRKHSIAIRFTETETVRPRDRLLQS